MKPGTEFLHNHWLNPDNKSEPMHCVVTRNTQHGIYWKPKAGGGTMYFPHEHVNKYVKQIIKEDGGAAGGGMAAGTGGFTNTAAAAGPTAGFDPILPLKKRIKKNITRAKPPGRPGEGLIGDNV